MPGQIIADRYVLQQELGAGGMGTVYLGVDSHTQQTVAIKQLKSQIAQPHMIERFKREGEALRELNHPNIVKMLDAVEEKGNHYLVMEYISGGDLKSLIDQHGNLSTQRCVNMAIDLADALTRAHRLNIIHRDLKPANVLIGDDGVLRLTDFGVAHVGSQERVTDTDSIVGTIDYLPPEAFGHGPVEAGGDIWAFGVMLFEMVSGRRPFAGQTIARLIHEITIAAIPDLEVLCPDVPTALIDLIYRMLERDPHIRISSVRYVGAALEDILRGRSQPSHTPRFETPAAEQFNRSRHNLPAQATQFVGRELELRELDKLLRDGDLRLITVLAPGGMGKTRLSLEAAEQALPHFDDGVYFVDLSSLSDPENIVSAIAEALSTQFQSDGRTPRQQLLDFLASKKMLLILDNFEHLLDGAGITTDILNAAGAVQILVTSRQRLSQPAETLFHLSGIDFPTWETPEDALEFAAVKLFMNSAKRAHRDFELTSDNLDYVARICKLVQGMPLGILLAASWLAMLSPQEIAAEIATSIDFLATDETTLPERQRSLEVVMDYSWQQMTEPEQQVFKKLSLFRGGFTREAAEAVADANLRVLMSLINKSLIRRDTDTGRYQIHELLRQYAETKLAADPVIQEEAMNWHSTFFSDFLEQRWEPIRSPTQRSIIREISVDFENIRIAWHYLMRKGNAVEIRGSLMCLWLYLFLTDRNEDGLELFGDKLPTDAHDQGLAQNIRAGYGWFKTMSGQLPEGKAIAQDSLKNVEGPPEQQDRILPLWTLAQATIMMGQLDETERAAQDSLRIARTINNKWMIATSLTYMGLTAIGRSDTAHGMQVMTEAASLMSEYGDPFAQGVALRQLGALAHANGEFQKAIDIYRRSIGFLEQAGQIYMLAFTRRSLSNAAIALEDFAEVQTQLVQCLLLYKRSGQYWEALELIMEIADWFVVQGMNERAVELFTVVSSNTFSRDSTRQVARERLAHLDATLSPDIYAEAHERGKKLDLDLVIDELLSEYGMLDLAFEVR